MKIRQGISLDSHPDKITSELDIHSNGSKPDRSEHFSQNSHSSRRKAANILRPLLKRKSKVKLIAWKELIINISFAKFFVFFERISFN